MTDQWEGSVCGLLFFLCFYNLSFPLKVTQSLIQSELILRSFCFVNLQSFPVYIWKEVAVGFAFGIKCVKNTTGSIFNRVEIDIMWRASELLNFNIKKECGEEMKLCPSIYSQSINSCSFSAYKMSTLHIPIIQELSCADAITATSLNDFYN